MAQSSESLRCSICLETFKEPKVLPCCHTFCKSCLAKLPLMKKPESEPSIRGEPQSRAVDDLSDGSDESEKIDSDQESSTRNPIDQDEIVPADQVAGWLSQFHQTVSLNCHEISPTDGESLADFLTCPQCRAEHKIIGPSGVDGFLNDYIIDSQLIKRTVLFLKECKRFDL